MDGRQDPADFTTSLEEDNSHVGNVFSNPISERQVIAFTEAALIRFFQPPYNTQFRERFPSPDHKSYEECYHLDINGIFVSLDLSCLKQTFEGQIGQIGCEFPIHYDLHNEAERRSLLDDVFRRKK
jgi:hypothetical protein